MTPEIAHSAARPADCVELVDEDDGRRRLTGLLEQIAHAARADAHDHLYELGRAHAEEGHAGLTRHGLGQQRLTCSWRAYEEHALGSGAAEARVLLRILEEVDDLDEL